jgi:diadenosine tetraphosphate (Ap4A) HIT family hydrolase
MSANFQLDARLQADTTLVGDMGLSRLLLMNDARYPWLVLVPRHSGLVEITDLSDSQAMMLMSEIRRCCNALRAACPCEKLNIGALGNVVRQLHVHVLARTTGDEAGNGPVWGVGRAQPYSPQVRDKLLAILRPALGLQEEA